VPSAWESFTESETDPNEVLFLQTPKGEELDATVTLSAYPLRGNWEDLVTRQTYHVVVFEGAPLIVDEELTLRGARGHKWVYKAKGPDGRQNLYYRLYLVLPESVGANRLLVMQGVVPDKSGVQAVPTFNALARSLNWGLQADSTL